MNNIFFGVAMVLGDESFMDTIRSLYFTVWQKCFIECDIYDDKRLLGFICSSLLTDKVTPLLSKNRAIFVMPIYTFL